MSSPSISSGHLTTQEAILLLRKNPDYRELIRDSYLGKDFEESANRFYRSAEFGEVMRLLKNDLSNQIVLDLGSGIGVAASAFARKGAGGIIAIDPDLGDQIGARAATKLSRNFPFHILAGLGENIPVEGGAFDIVYSRQVLHHAENLKSMVSEIFRVLRPGGTMLATREHVVDNQSQLKRFLAEHPVHQLAGGEHAFRLTDYHEAIREAGFHIEKIIGPWDSVINAFPNVRSQSELCELPSLLLRQRFGKFGLLASHIPGVVPLIWFYLRRRSKPGRMYSFVAIKPS